MIKFTEKTCRGDDTRVQKPVKLTLIVCSPFLCKADLNQFAGRCKRQGDLGDRLILAETMKVDEVAESNQCRGINLAIRSINKAKKQAKIDKKNARKRKRS